ncbi:MAG TPA: hypothetical protein VNQ79_25260 [Blastocatellia bacterium]|nr:hypothetical protein [Blastocatellia bacterium]
MHKTAATMLFCLLIIVSGLAWHSRASAAFEPQATPKPLPCDCNNQKKITICHRPPGNPQNALTLEIACDGQNGHKNHEQDYCGPCQAVSAATPTPATCLERNFTAPAVTHGVSAADDLFALSQPLSFTIVSPSMTGADIFNVTAASSGSPGTFGLPVSNATTGAGVGFISTANAQGFGFSTAGERLVAVSCLDSFWDINFVIAGTGATAGDTVSLLMRAPDGTVVADALAQFTVGNGSVTLTHLGAGVSLFLNNRLANGANAVTLASPNVPFVSAPSGSTFSFRTGVLTLALPMDPGSPFHGCQQFAAVIERPNGAPAGTTALVFTDIVVNRDDATTATGTGLLSGGSGVFPTAPLCEAICPPCPVVSGGGGCPVNGFTAASVTHGAGGDQFLLSDPLNLTLVSSPSGSGIVTVPNLMPNATTGFLPGVTPQGIALAQQGTALALSCSDSFWDVNFVILSTGATGDQARLFLRTPGSSTDLSLATFTVQANGVVVTDLSSDVTLFHNNRLANGGQLIEGSLISTPPGSPGISSGLLTLSLMAPGGQSLSGCYQLGLELSRAGNATGVTAVIIGDVVVNRTAASTSTGTGLIFGTTGSFPTGLPCNPVCPACPTGTQPAKVVNVSAASYQGATLACESIVAGFGDGLAASVQTADTLPLPTTLAGVKVKVKDAAGTERAAPLFFVSPKQINYQLPPGTAPGEATITIEGAGRATERIKVAPVAPSLFTANATGNGAAAAFVLRVKADGSQRFEPVVAFDQAQNKFVPVPIDLGPPSDQVFLILFGTGVRFCQSNRSATVKIDGETAEVLYLGPQGQFVGLDQINVRLSRNLIGRGDVSLSLTAEGLVSNTVRLKIK